MYIKNLKLNNIRNYEEEYINFDKKLNIILGKNGQGKTNLIESIYVAAISKSFRTKKEKEIIKFGCDIGKIDINYIRDNEKENINFIINKKGEKSVLLNDIKLKKVSDLIGNILVVVFSPDDLKIIKEDPEKRRAFIDRELCQISLSYFKNLSDYKKILYQRNKYLKEDNINKNVLEVWNESLANCGNIIIDKRKDFIENLNNISNKIHSNIKKEENLLIKYKSNINENENFLEILNKSLDTDLKLKTTSRGPHKDDIDIYINDINTRKYGSQGQQRTAALSLKLAEIEIIKELKKENPILLLDDVMSELDEERQKFIINYLEDIQLFITTTHLSSGIESYIEKNNIIYIKEGRAELYE